MLRRWMLALGLAAALMILWAGAVLASSGGQEGKPGQPIEIRWSTETEVNTAGFNIYRAQAEEGPWVKINSTLVPASPDPLRGGSYVFTDTNVIAGQAYWYELEEIELSGKATRLERTQAEARPLGPAGLAGIPCASGSIAFLALGAVIASRRAGSGGLEQRRQRGSH